MEIDARKKMSASQHKRDAIRRRMKAADELPGGDGVSGGGGAREQRTGGSRSRISPITKSTEEGSSSRRSSSLDDVPEDDPDGGRSSLSHMPTIVDPSPLERQTSKLSAESPLLPRQILAFRAEQRTVRTKGGSTDSAWAAKGNGGSTSAAASVVADSAWVALDSGEERFLSALSRARRNALGLAEGSPSGKENVAANFLDDDDAEGAAVDDKQSELTNDELGVVDVAALNKSIVSRLTNDEEDGLDRGEFNKGDILRVTTSEAEALPNIVDAEVSPVAVDELNGGADVGNAEKAAPIFSTELELDNGHSFVQPGQQAARSDDGRSEATDGRGAAGIGRLSVGLLGELSRTGSSCAQFEILERVIGSDHCRQLQSSIANFASEALDRGQRTIFEERYDDEEAARAERFLSGIASFGVDVERFTFDEVFDNVNNAILGDIDDDWEGGDDDASDAMPDDTTYGDNRGRDDTILDETAYDDDRGRSVLDETRVSSDDDDDDDRVPNSDDAIPRGGAYGDDEDVPAEDDPARPAAAAARDASSELEELRARFSGELAELRAHNERLRKELEAERSRARAAEEDVAEAAKLAEEAGTALRESGRRLRLDGRRRDGGDPGAPPRDDDDGSANRGRASEGMARLGSAIEAYREGAEDAVERLREKIAFRKKRLLK